MFQSGGVLVKTSITTWRGNTANFMAGTDLLGLSWSYSAIYRRQLWVAVLVNKIAYAHARLPLKVYERGTSGRNEVRDHPYAQLLRSPNAVHDPFFFWVWTSSTRNIYGEAFWGKVRDAGGRPIELIPLHPVNVKSEERDGKVRWSYDDGERRIDKIDRRDLVHFKAYNPDSLTRGLSPLEPLRATLENEEGARRANSAMWRNGGRPSVVLEHPKELSDAASTRLAENWAELHGGVDNWAKAAVLEEGLQAKILPLNVEELQYVEARRLNREESCAIYDVPPPVVHILDRATFSNITEQMRSMYRDTMAPKLGETESTLDAELRDGRMGTDEEPDFSDNVYAEFLMDEVLRGDFEVRTESYQRAINAGWMTPAEARTKENLPFIEGSDRLLINSTLVPLKTDDGGMSVADVTLALQKIYLAVGVVITADEARDILNRGGAGLGATPDDLGSALPAPMPDATMVRSLMGRLSRVTSLDELDPVAFVTGLNGEAPIVKGMLLQAVDDGLTVDEFKTMLRALPPGNPNGPIPPPPR